MKLRFILAIVAVFLMQGCAQKPLSPKGEAVFYALQADTMLRTWVSQCRDVSPRARQAGLTARNNWWERNGPFVEGADFGLAYNIVTVTDTRAETGARLAMAMTWEVTERAEETVTKLMEKAGDDEGREELCIKILGQYNQGKWDLHGSDETYNELVTLQRRSVNDAEKLDLRRGMVELKTQRQFGRSLYVVEKLSKRQGCPNAEVQLLKGEWPYEIYDVACPDESHLLMRCEWGNCLVLQ